jgi:predicted Zn-dependent protease
VSAALDSVVGAVLDEVARCAGSAAAAVVRAEQASLALTRFADSAIHQNVADDRVTVHLSLTVDGGRTATVSTTRAGDPASLVGAALAAARLRPRDPSWPGLGAPAPVTSTGSWDDATASASPADRAGGVRAFVDAAGGLSCAGYVQTSALTTVLATTAGQHVRGASTSATCDGIARLSGADGVARSMSSRLGDLAYASLGARAAAKARAGVDARPVDPGAYAVVLEPAAVSDVVAALVTGQLNGKAVVDGTSGIGLGTAQFDPAVSLADDPLDGVGLPFDTEGTPTGRLDLVRDGVPVALTTDRRTAAQLGGSSSGHASDVSETWGPVAGSPSLAAGSGGSVDDLVAGLERGLLVSDFWYTRVVDPKRSVWTGLTRNGVWLVEDGRIVAPVSTLRFTQSYLEALAPGAVTVGSVVDPQPQRLTWQAASRVAVPALRLATWNITGNTTG